MSYAVNQYRRAAGATLSPREAEAAAFVLVDRMLEAAELDAGQRTSALGRNHELWSMLMKDVGMDGNRLPPILKQDLLFLGVWSMRYSIAAMGDDRELEPLRAINQDMIAALRAEHRQAAGPAPVLTLAG